MKIHLSNIYIKLIAAFLIFIGFGMIHSSMLFIEKTGSVLIGVGSIYFILILIVSFVRKT